MKLIIDIPNEEYKTLSKVSEKEKANELSYYERVIANGIPITEGDLIMFRTLMTEIANKGLPFEEVLLLIDNAPTVEYPFYQEAYQTGYEEGQNKRPQGEWIMQRHDLDGEFYTCSICGRMIRISPYAEDNESLADYPFCHCGAEMQKGGAE